MDTRTPTTGGRGTPARVGGPLAERVVRRPPVRRPPQALAWAARHRWTGSVVVVAMGVVAGLLVPSIDNSVHLRGDYTFDVGTAQATLAAVAGGMITLTGFVFTAVTLVIQTVQSQSPRLLRAIDRTDRTPAVFGMFAATFTYALVVLSQVREGSVPVIAVYVAIALVLVCVGLFFRLLVTVRTRLTSGGLVRTVGGELRRSFESLYPRSGIEVAEPRPREEASQQVESRIAYPGPPGVLQALDERALVGWAARNDAVVEFETAVGDFVPTGRVVAVAHARGDLAKTSTLTRHIHVGPHRTLEQDPAYGFRLLVDIAVRALSPAVNDPTTAVQTLDQLDDMLHRLADRPLGNGEVVDESGVVRLRYPGPAWESFVSLALDEIRIYGASSLQVVRRLGALLNDLAAEVPRGRQAPLERRLGELEAANEGNFAGIHDRVRAGEQDRQGLGGPER